MDDFLKKLQQAVQNGYLLASAFENSKNFLCTPHLPNWAYKSMQELIKSEQWQELNNRFFKFIEFGTAGMRGRTISNIPTTTEKSNCAYLHAAIGTAYMNDFNVILATIGLFHHCQAYLTTACDYLQRPRLVIAYDSRYFSKHFCQLTASTWHQLGGEVYSFDGPRSTPQLSFTIRYLKATAGVMITASHNPFFDNGYKVYFTDGAQISEMHADDITKNIQMLTYADSLRFLNLHLQSICTLTSQLDRAYADCCEEVILNKTLFKKMKTTKIVYTPLHGTGSVCILPLLKKLQWDVYPVQKQIKMDGAFPTIKSPNPDNPETLQLALKEAKRIKADGIIATDPDGDRMSAMLEDEQGKWQLLNGNTIAIILAEYRLEAMKTLKLLPKSLKKWVIIKSFVTTPLLKKFAKKNGLKCIETHTGFKWIGAKLNTYETQLNMKLHDKGICLDYTHCTCEARRQLMQRYANFLFLGAEESCGFLANDAVRDKDGNAAVLMFCEFIAYLKSKKLNFTDFLEKIYRKYGYFKEDLLSFTFDGAEGMKQIQNLIHSYRQQPPKQMANTAVISVIDFSKKLAVPKDADGDPVPAGNFMMIKLANGCSVAIRPSGTEPKLKLYLFAESPLKQNDNLDHVRQIILERLSVLKAWLQHDITLRSH